MKVIDSNNVWYTQKIDGLPIEERVFFRRAIGMMADDEHFRPATVDELEAKRIYDDKLNAEAMGICNELNF